MREACGRAKGCDRVWQDQCPNGNNCHKKNDSPSATWSVSHSNRSPSYNPCADESDYDDNETPDIVDLYGEEVYNNID